MITLKTRLISTLIHLLKMLNSRTVMIRKVILLTQPMKIMSAKSALFQSAEAVASVMNMFVEVTLTFLQSRNRVDIGVRVELPAAIFSHLTDELYESKIVYRTERSRTMCVHSA